MCMCLSALSVCCRDADCASAGNYVSSLVSWRQSGTDLGARQVAQDKHVVELAPARSGTGGRAAEHSNACS